MVTMYRFTGSSCQAVGMLPPAGGGTLAPALTAICHWTYIDPGRPRYRPWVLAVK
jgi:hypothetical protein